MPKGLVHCIAECKECDWREDNYLTAQAEARKHHAKTGHKITIEAGYAWTVGKDE